MTSVVAAVVVVGYVADLVGLFGFFVLCAYLVKTGGSVDLPAAIAAYRRRSK